VRESLPKRRDCLCGIKNLRFRDTTNTPRFRLPIKSCVPSVLYCRRSPPHHPSHPLPFCRSSRVSHVCQTKGWAAVTKLRNYDMRERRRRQVFKSGQKYGRTGETQTVVSRRNGYRACVKISTKGERCCCCCWCVPLLLVRLGVSAFGSPGAVLSHWRRHFAPVPRD
jgi:hypothetical protein